jgi:hypothetical protein
MVDHKQRYHGNLSQQYEKMVSPFLLSCLPYQSFTTSSQTFDTFRLQPANIHCMKTLLCVFLFCAALAQAADVQLRVVRKGKDVPMPAGTPLITNVIALIQSCTVHSNTWQSTRPSTPEIWTHLLTSNSFVHIKFALPSILTFEATSNHGREEYLVHEILLGLPEGKWAGPLLIRTDNTVHSFGKYDPRVLKRVTFEPALDLSSVRPYSDLANLEETPK